MGVVFQAGAATATANPTTGWTVVLGAGIQADDDVYVCVFSRSHTSANYPSVTDDDSGGNTWSLIGESSNHRNTVWHKKATSGTASKTVTVASAIDSSTGGYFYVRGAHLTAPNVDASGEINAAGDESHAGFTPSAADAMICAFIGVRDNIPGKLPVSIACTDPGALTDRFSEFSSGGNDCCATFACALQSGGPTATGTFTWAMTDEESVSVVWAIQPAAGGGGSPQTGSSGVSTSAWSALAGLAVLGGVIGTPSPSTAQWTTPVPIAVSAIVATPAPSVSQWVATQPTAVSGSVTATPAVSVLTWVTPAPVAIPSGVTASPAVSTSQWTTPAPTTVSGAVTGSPLPSISAWVAPDPTGNLGTFGIGAAAVSTWVAAVPSAVLGGAPQTGTASPGISTWAVPAPTALTSVTGTPGSPSVATWAVPAPSATTGATTGIAATSVHTWVTPQPIGNAQDPDTDLVLAVIQDLTAPRLAGVVEAEHAIAPTVTATPKYTPIDLSGSRYRGS